EFGGCLPVNGQFLSSRDFSVQTFDDILRDLDLDHKQVIQIAIVLLGSVVGVGACIDQLRVEAKMCSGSADAALQNVRHPQIISDLTEISFAAVLHHAGPANHFEVGDLCQLGQDVVLHTIGK